MTVNGTNTPIRKGLWDQREFILRELKKKWNFIYKKHYFTLARDTSGVWGSAVCDEFGAVSSRVDWHKIERTTYRGGINLSIWLRFQILMLESLV